MKHEPLLAALPLVLAQACIAVAGALDITGNYGDPTGCKVAAAAAAESDDLLLLTPEEVSTYATLCRFLQAVPADENTRVVTIICGHEGEEAQTLELMRIEKDADGADAYTVFNQMGDSWGRAARCP